MLAYLLLGLGLGVGTSAIPGVCGLAVIGAARTRGKRHAIGLACGAALGDAVYSAIGLLGAAHLFARNPEIQPLLRAASAVILLVYAALALRPRPRATDLETTTGSVARSFAIGLGLCLLNASALVTWVVIVGSALGGAPTSAQLATVVGVGLGTAGWFSGLGILVARGASRDGAIVTLTRVVCALLIVYGTAMLVQVLAT